MFDIDNTICITKRSSYSNSVPKTKIIKVINELFKKNYYIKIFTSRYMGRNNDNMPLVKKKYYLKTKKQLKSWDLMFHELILGKPSYDLHFDDKSFNIKEKKSINKLLNLK
tara:strand:- start:1441 stop:1773 length:333 start_codon:yes stop_codon:yes gene_type:complete